MAEVTPQEAAGLSDAFEGKDAYGQFTPEHARAIRLGGNRDTTFDPVLDALLKAKKGESDRFSDGELTQSERNVIIGTARAGGDPFAEDSPAQDVGRIRFLEGRDIQEPTSPLDGVIPSSPDVSGALAKAALVIGLIAGVLIFLNAFAKGLGTGVAS